jgi:hypothetical protein
MNTFRVCLLGAALLCGGCVTLPPEGTTLVGGSRADGTVAVMWHAVRNTTVQDFDYATQMLQTARAACIKWGYLDAERFGQVLARSFVHPIDAHATYQCIGKPLG